MKFKVIKIIISITMIFHSYLAKSQENVGSEKPMEEAVRQEKSSAAADSNKEDNDRNKKEASKPGSGFVDPDRTNSFLNSLTSTTRETGKSPKITKDGLKMVLDLRLPLIFKQCDLPINHEMLRLAYAYLAEFPGSESQLKSTADSIVRKKRQEFKGVSAKCQAELKGFSIAVLRVYLGNEWNEKDEERLQNAIQSKDQE